MNTYGSPVQIDIDSSSAEPPYEQVRGQIARQIIDHTLAVGTRLPTVRALAADLGIAVNTVARSYRELEEAGLVETRGRAGTYVSAAGESARAAVQRAAREYAANATALGIGRDEALRMIEAALDEAR
ncbi:DNA-binding transcriptional regulator YhcF (GntR family) [Herbihabitans rhizosphaerae]|uniref:DNA-binding transcriptional regulator YhcF (GntR family) n=1 Tax=Herbihabitans rhizosphaerae TaxID=1872711 RepID=A0A4V2ERH9_9PSEU|nr:DNA-binding transcriptional regulator YhcF (GntR family) [Herbihabitans rhizosphaerae]